MKSSKLSRVSQYGGNSFKDFNEDYENLTKNITSRFKHFNQSLPITATFDPETSAPSYAPAIKQFDGFITDSSILPLSSSQSNRTSIRSSQKPSSQAQSDNSSSHQPQQQQGNTLNLQGPYQNRSANGQSSLKNQSSRSGHSSQARESFYFTSVPRFSNDENFKMIDYPSRYSKLNFLVSERRDVDQTYYNRNFTTKLHADSNSMQLSMCNLPSTLMNPSQKRLQLDEIKFQQKEFQEQKKQFLQVNKRHRVHKGMYSSGILAVDNPLNANSQLYKEEVNADLQLQMRLSRNRTAHKEIISELYKTDPRIEFFNSQNNSPSQRRTSANQQREKISSEWTNKKPYTAISGRQQTDTNDRLFGAEAKNYSIKRAQYLRGQETHQRNFNPISYTDNAIEFKQDQGITVHK